MTGGDAGASAGANATAGSGELFSYIGAALNAVYQRVIKRACTVFQAGTFIKLLIVRAFCCTKKSLMASCDSGCNAVQLRGAYLYSLSVALAAGHAVAVCPLGGCCVAAGGLKTIGYLSALQSNNLNPALALWDSCLNAEKNVGGLAATYSIVVSYLNKILRDKIELTYRKSAHLAVICGRLFSAFRHSSSSFLTRLFYHYYYFTRAAMSLGGIGSAYGSSLASLSLNQSKNINKINNNESKNTDIQRLLEGLCFAAC